MEQVRQTIDEWRAATVAGFGDGKRYVFLEGRRKLAYFCDHALQCLKVDGEHTYLWTKDDRLSQDIQDAGIRKLDLPPGAPVEVAMSAYVEAKKGKAGHETYAEMVADLLLAAAAKGLDPRDVMGSVRRERGVAGVSLDADEEVEPTAPGPT